MSRSTTSRRITSRRITSRSTTSRRITSRSTTSRLLKLSRQRGVKLPVYQDVKHFDGLARAVAPRVAGAALDDDVAGLEVDVALVQQQDDLAFEYHRVIHRFGAVHHRVAPAAAVSRRVAAA